MDENIFSFGTKQIVPIHTLHDLLRIANIVKEIQGKMKEIEDNPNIEDYVKKIMVMELQEEINDNGYISSLTIGIKIKKDILIKEIINMVIAFLEEKGFDNEILINRLRNVRFYVSDIPLISGGGQFDNANSIIGIDYRYCVFDETGNFISLNDKKRDILIHALIHELFHDLSRAKKDQPLSEALNEGMTEMFAHIVSRKQNVNIESSWYSFIKKVCELFAFLIGFDKVFMDYVTDPIELACIRELFNECDKSSVDFHQFRSELNRFLQLKQKNVDCSEIEKQIAIFLKQAIVIPYIQKHPELIQVAIEKYNTIFGKYELISETEIEKSKVN